jgi:spermidine synthase
MPRPYRVIARVQTPEGPLELLQKGDSDFVIRVDGRVLMSSGITLSEIAVAEHGVAPIRHRPAPRVLIGGLGLGYTLRAALDALPATAQVEVAELNPIVVDWCRGPAAACHGDALSDPRVRVVIGDVAACVRGAASGRSPAYDAIIVDLYLGPTADDGGARDPLYGTAILSATFAALAPGGRYAVWGEQRHPPFEERLRRAGFAVTFRNERGGGPRHAVYLADRPGPASGRR